MSNRLYHDPKINIENVATELEHTFNSHGYQTQHFGNSDQIAVQMRKGGNFATIVGMQTALTVTMKRSPHGILTMIGNQKWVDKAIVGAVGIVAAPFLWPLMITAGVGAIQQVNLDTHVMNAIDTAMRKQNPEVQFGPIPPEVMPQYEQPAAPHASPPPPWQRWTSWTWPGGTQKVICANCHTPNEPGDSYCMQCGQSLKSQEPQKKLCPNCGADTKPGATFCTNCGTSLTQQEEQRAE
jgi:Double zinc ribbon